jgi:ABC-type antimicrobial peptide transport system permease subunit
VNRAFAAAWFASGNAVGQQLRIGGDSQPWSTIVGVVTDTSHSTLEEAARPSVYQPLWGSFKLDLTVKSRLPAAEAASMIREVLRRMDPTVPAMEIQTIGEIISVANARRRFETSVLSGFAAFAIFLALVGVYGLTMFTVGQRTAEIGIRMAVGGSQARVVSMLVAQNLVPVVVGLAIGMAGASALARVLASSLYDVTPFDPATYLAVPCFTLLVAFVACLIPARNAARIDPVAALRHE